MNILRLFALILLTTGLGVSVQAQGGFGAPMAKITPIDDQTGVLFGGMGGAFYDRFYFGGVGMGLINGDTYNRDEAGTQLSELSMGYGGLLFGYMDYLAQSVGWYAQGITAWGSYSWEQADGGSFFMLEPEIGLNLITGHHVNMGLGFGYRWAIPTSNGQFDMSQLSGFNFTIAIKFGELKRMNDE